VFLAVYLSRYDIHTLKRVESEVEMEAVKLTLEIQDADGAVKATSTDNNNVYLTYEDAYAEGDIIVLKSNQEKGYLVIQLDDAMNPAFVYFSGSEYRFKIPFAEKKKSYSPKTFHGAKHLILARVATKDEITSYKNVALNEYDQHENEVCFPHASANVETRGESVFAARNAINGNFANHDHGAWPFESWGINQQDDAALTINFGRIVEIDQVAITLRADFPHDNYWEQATLTFSDGSQQMIKLVKTNKPQPIQFDSRKVEWLKISELIKSVDPSPFPALTQIEVFGREV